MRWMLPSMCLVVIGCGPMSKPMVVRLEEESQTAIDGAWENMLTPVDRLDRILLLDTVLANQLHQLGVDHLHFVSEKEVAGGVLIMEVVFDREEPES